MGKIRKRGFIFLVAMIMVSGNLVWSQTDSLSLSSDQGATEIDVSLSVQTSATEVPLNRTVEIDFELQWTGDLDRIEILPFDNPILNNFEIVGNASSNKVTSKDGQSQAIREYNFTLKPKAMGMGYVESFIIRYTDLDTDTDFTLTTNRLEIKAVDPLSEPGDKSWMLWIIPVLAIVGGAVYLLVYLQRRKAERLEQERLLAEQNKPVEETLLQQLKSEIDLNAAAPDVTAGINIVTRLARQYLAEKHDIQTQGTATEDIVNNLDAIDLDAKSKIDLKQVLKQGDILKFSGGSATQAELERLYGLLEAVLFKSLQEQTGTGTDTDQ